MRYNISIPSSLRWSKVLIIPLKSPLRSALSPIGALYQTFSGTCFVVAYLAGKSDIQPYLPPNQGHQFFLLPLTCMCSYTFCQCLLSHFRKIFTSDEYFFSVISCYFKIISYTSYAVIKVHRCLIIIAKPVCCDFFIICACFVSFTSGFIYLSNV